MHCLQKPLRFSMAFQQAAAWKQCAQAMGAQPWGTGVAKNTMFNIVPHSFIFQFKNPFYTSFL